MVQQESRITELQKTTEYLIGNLDSCSPDKRVDIAFKLSLIKFIAYATQNTWQLSKDLLSLAVRGFTLILLLQGGINYHLTQWFLSIEVLKIPAEQTQAVAEAIDKAIPAVDLVSDQRLEIQNKIIDAAKSWVNKDFNPGIEAQCANFVRQVLKDAGIDLPVTQTPIDGMKPTGEALANGLFGEDIGEFIKDKSQLLPGDLVFFGGTYGGYPDSVVTHIGIYIGNGEIVDRPTKAEPVKKRSIDTFKTFSGGIRPYAYSQSQPQEIEVSQTVTKPVTKSDQSVVCVFVPSSNACGSGIAVSKDTIVTNAHVLESESAEIRLDSIHGQPIKGKVVKLDKAQDLALIKVDVSNLVAIDVSYLEQYPRESDKVSVIGFPQQFNGQRMETTGSVIALNKDCKSGGFQDCIYVSPGAVFPGNSGGFSTFGITRAIAEKDMGEIKAGTAAVIPWSRVKEFLK